jgi:hypothetical protein
VVREKIRARTCGRAKWRSGGREREEGARDKILPPTRSSLQIVL